MSILVQFTALADKNHSVDCIVVNCLNDVLFLSDLEVILQYSLVQKQYWTLFGVRLDAFLASFPLESLSGSRVIKRLISFSYEKQIVTLLSNSTFRAFLVVSCLRMKESVVDWLRLRIQTV